MFCSLRYIVKCIPNKLVHQVLVQYSVATCENNLIRKECTQNNISSLHGQPTSSTHPHLIKDGEITPGVSLQEFKRRRIELMKKIISHPTVKHVGESLVIVPSASKVYMSDKIPYVFRQNTDFLYLTGCQEPDTVLVMTVKNENCISTLFMREKDEHSEMWDGPRTGVETAPEMFGMDQALPTSEFERFVGSFINEHTKSIVWYDNSNVVQAPLHRKLCGIVKVSDNERFVSPASLIHQIRLIKSNSEQALIHKSCEIASAAIKKTIQVARTGMTEHELFATVDYECRMNGAEFLAYPPVVAGGKNANIIHYINNNQIIQDGDMVLMDAGCEYHGYTSDITRTWPINGVFSPEQRILYELILDVQEAMIQKLMDMPSLDQVFHNMCLLLGKRLQEIGLIPKSLSGDKLLTAAYSYCPHHVSHYLGMDVHDTGKISRNIPIQPGMVITIEPGVYINPKNKLAPPDFYGLGIRIEDDILITKDGPVVLSNKCPKKIDEIEGLAKQNQSKR